MEKSIDTPLTPELEELEEPKPAIAAADEFKPGWRFILAFLSLTTITLMVALDATSLSVALPIMAKLLHGSAIEGFWAGTSFLLTSTIFQPVLGSFSSIFGRMPIVWISLALFGIGAIVAATSNDFTSILAGRSIQGIGGGGIITLTEIIVTDMVPLRVRGQWFAFISSAWAIGESCSITSMLLFDVNSIKALSQALFLEVASVRMYHGGGSSTLIYHLLALVDYYLPCFCVSTLSRQHSSTNCERSIGLAPCSLLLR
jgi:MFS family permease